VAIPVTLLLAAALIGVPAAAVVCGLVLCEPQAASTVQGCHEHGGSEAGDAIAAAASDCMHLASSAPFVPAGPRHAGDSPFLAVAATSTARADVAARAAAWFPSRAGPPPPAFLVHVLRV
jgi:hypothetical protein